MGGVGGWVTSPENMSSLNSWHPFSNFSTEAVSHCFLRKTVIGLLTAFPDILLPHGLLLRFCLASTFD